MRQGGERAKEGMGQVGGVRNIPVGSLPRSPVESNTISDEIGRQVTTKFYLQPPVVQITDVIRHLQLVQLGPE